MKVLFDQNVSHNLRTHLSAHEVSTSAELGWDELQNGDLLTAAEAAGFDVFVTGDQSLTYQQDLSSRVIAIVELTKNNWPSVQPNLPRIVAAVDASTPGSYQIIDFPYVYRGRQRRPRPRGGL
jgi:hypothetical protein